jgi:hypothetical protein
VVSILAREYAYDRYQTYFPHLGYYVEDQEEYDSVDYFNGDLGVNGEHQGLQYSVCRQCGDFYKKSHSFDEEDVNPVTRRHLGGSSTIVVSPRGLCDCTFYLGIYYWASAAKIKTVIN